MTASLDDLGPAALGHDDPGLDPRVRPVPAVALDAPWSLSPRVALRPEPFGALAYHFGNRRLSFLKRLQLVEVVEGLSGATSVRDALVAAGVPSGAWPAYLAALDGLARADMVVPRAS